jgi:hypothetical protein
VYGFYLYLCVLETENQEVKVENVSFFKNQVAEMDTQLSYFLFGIIHDML